MYHHLVTKPNGASKYNQGLKETKPGNTGCDNTVSKPEKSSMDYPLQPSKFAKHLLAQLNHQIDRQHVPILLINIKATGSSLSDQPVSIYPSQKSTKQGSYPRAAYEYCQGHLKPQNSQTNKPNTNIITLIGFKEGLGFPTTVGIHLA